MASEELRLSRRVSGILARAGIDPGELTKLTERELLGLPGFGPCCLRDVIDALSEAGLVLAEDPYAPYVCVREGRQAWDVNLADLFLCDECADEWETNAFGGDGAAYVGTALSGYCVSCNRKKDVRLRQWMLCGNCERVARSIGRGVSAERYLSEEWQRIGMPPQLELRQLDTPTLRGRRKDEAQVKIPAIDFAVHDHDRGQDAFGFELKTGKKHLGRAGLPGGRMSEFQLDTTDCDDIASVMGQRGIPVFLVHVQVIDRAFAPTVLYVPVGAWWADPFRMAAGFKRVQQRSRETRDAAYFEPSIFEDIGTFAEYVRAAGVERLDARLRLEGVPPMYRRH